jgi:hypothetical protein
VVVEVVWTEEAMVIQDGEELVTHQDGEDGVVAVVIRIHIIIVRMEIVMMTQQDIKTRYHLLSLRHRRHHNSHRRHLQHLKNKKINNLDKLFLFSFIIQSYDRT